MQQATMDMCMCTCQAARYETEIIFCIKYMRVKYVSLNTNSSIILYITRAVLFIITREISF